MVKVFLNPGHAPGIDPGAVNDEYGVTEAAIVKDVGELVEKYLVIAGCEVKVLQSNNLAGEDPDYPNVCLTANTWDADIFVSLHCNSFSNPSANGTETCVYSSWSQSGDLAHCIQDQIVDNLGTCDRGIKERPNLIVLKDTKMPAVLVEMAFISNDDDVKLLIDSKDAFARAIARGVTDYLTK